MAHVAQAACGPPGGGRVAWPCALLAIGALFATVLPAAGAQAPVAEPGTPRAFLDAWCVACHNDRTRTAGLSLSGLNLGDPSGEAEVLERVVRKLRAYAMPPAGAPRPGRVAYDRVASDLEEALDRAATARPDAGSPTLRRLNVAEYGNAVRDLLGIDVDGGAWLPADEPNANGFTGDGDALSASPALLEAYLAAARTISRLAVGDLTIGPAASARTYRVPKLRFQDARMDDALPFGSRGGVAVRHHFPLDGEYVLSLRLQRTGYDYVRGLTDRHAMEVRLDGERLRTFQLGGETGWRAAPASYSGNIFSADPEWEEYMVRGADAALEVRFPARAGLHVVGVSFVRQRYEQEGVAQPPLRGFAFEINESVSSFAGTSDPAVATVTIGGPWGPTSVGDTPSRRRIFVCRPSVSSEERACAERILSRLGKQAFRRDLHAGDIGLLLEFFESGRAQGGFERGVQLAIQRLLVDPEFLFRIEPSSGVDGRDPARLSDRDLASRLSLFLWSSNPDDALMAARSSLREPSGLARQVRRMLADDRSAALVQNFATQWLGLARLAGAAPDPTAFPDFEENLREAFSEETRLFLTSQLREDRSVLELLTADYTFVNERLAAHYGIPNVRGSRFRRVPLDARQRSGLLGHGSILTITSYATRTSPVVRGKWLLDNLLGTPPSPPPPDVPALRDIGENGEPASVRERLEQHRRNPACASCHVWMDPLGFALEHFDAVGAWRAAAESGGPVDASGVLPGSAEFEGLRGLQGFLLDRRAQFVRALVEKLLAYAIGRDLRHYDMPAVRRIVRAAARENYRWSSLIQGVAASVPFQMRSSGS
ncbi:MAG: DUF1592 domain-containing protein [Acidimicrobiia bacterium]|nr:DUF1592 domain-containing protein [Acidimicrobiia bacterium]